MKIELFFTTYFAALYGNIFAKALLIAICADMVFGSLRAIKYRKWNSSVGIDGGIRKVGMTAAVLLLTLVDMLLNINLIGWVDAEISAVLASAGIVKLGITELFAFLFTLYEATSILKNMLLCGLPIPAGLRDKVAKWLEKMTDETNVPLRDENKYPDISLDEQQLISMGLDNLKKMADDWDLDYPEDVTAEQLAAIIASQPVSLL